MSKKYRLCQQTSTPSIFSFFIPEDQCNVTLQFQSVSDPVGLLGVTSAWAALKELLTPTPSKQDSRLAMWVYTPSPEGMETATLTQDSNIYIYTHISQWQKYQQFRPWHTSNITPTKRTSPRPQCPAGPCQDHGLIVDQQKTSVPWQAAIPIPPTKTNTCPTMYGIFTYI